MLHIIVVDVAIAWTNDDSVYYSLLEHICGTKGR